ncbi:MAG: hypothetical protein EOL87_08875 [Spartobacteria bacterium]|nr:hypothetical protein [Spartobacteria bacterium]
MKKQIVIITGIALLIAAPLAGGLVRGLPAHFQHFPPLLSRSPVPSEALWPVCLLFVALLVLVLSVFIQPEAFKFSPAKVKEMEKPKEPDINNITLSASDVFDAQTITLPPLRRRLPVFGWCGISLILLTFLVIILPFHWLDHPKKYARFSMIFGLYLFIDAENFLHHCESIIRSTPRLQWLLFPISSLIWWYTEFLNRITGYWYLNGINDYSGTQYIIQMTLDFAPVLPLFLTIRNALVYNRKFHIAFGCGLPFKPDMEIFSFLSTCVGILGMFLIGLFSDYFFFCVYLAPLSVLFGILILCDIRIILDPLQHGNYVPLMATLLAGLLLGVLLEFTNSLVWPQLVHHIPYINMGKLFGMPVAAYSGYIIFGALLWCMYVMLLNLLPDSAITYFGVDKQGEPLTPPSAD